jgi:hypothetical protein
LEENLSLTKKTAGFGASPLPAAQSLSIIALLQHYKGKD